MSFPTFSSEGTSQSRAVVDSKEQDEARARFAAALLPRLGVREMLDKVAATTH